VSVKIEREGHVVTLTIDRPEARNSLNAEVLQGLVDGLASATGDPTSAWSS
jgi:enoyl-CoA hydratase